MLTHTSERSSFCTGVRLCQWSHIRKLRDSIFLHPELARFTFWPRKWALRATTALEYACAHATPKRMTDTATAPGDRVGVAVIAQALQERARRRYLTML